MQIRNSLLLSLLRSPEKSIYDFPTSVKQLRIEMLIGFTYSGDNQGFGIKTIDLLFLTSPNIDIDFMQFIYTCSNKAPRETYNKDFYMYLYDYGKIQLVVQILKALQSTALLRAVFLY